MTNKPSWQRVKTDPPNWAKDAVPSERGWHDPKTGELLVACRGIEIHEREIPIAAPVSTETKKPKRKKKKKSRRKKLMTKKLITEPAVPTETPIVSTPQFDESKVLADVPVLTEKTVIKAEPVVIPENKELLKEA